VSQSDSTARPIVIGLADPKEAHLRFEKDTF